LPFRGIGYKQAYLGNTRAVPFSDNWYAVRTGKGRNAEIDGAIQNTITTAVEKPLTRGRSIDADFIGRVGAGANKGRRDGLIGG
jgi:hypothetical protein